MSSEGSCHLNNNIEATRQSPPPLYTVASHSIATLFKNKLSKEFQFIEIKPNSVATERLDNGVVPWVRNVLQQVVERPLPCHIVLHNEPQKRQHRKSPCTNKTIISYHSSDQNPKFGFFVQDLTIGDFLLFGLKSRGEIQGIENATRVADFVWRQTVLLENGVLVHAAGVFNVLPSSDFDVMEEDELDHEQG